MQVVVGDDALGQRAAFQEFELCLVELPCVAGFDLLESVDSDDLRHLAVDLKRGVRPIDRCRQDSVERAQADRQRRATQYQPAMLEQKPQVFAEIEPAFPWIGGIFRGGRVDLWRRKLRALGRQLAVARSRQPSIRRRHGFRILSLPATRRRWHLRRFGLKRGILLIPAVVDAGRLHAAALVPASTEGVFVHEIRP